MQPQPALTDTEANMYTLVASDAVVLFLICSLNDFQCSVPAGYEKYLLSHNKKGFRIYAVVPSQMERKEIDKIKALGVQVRVSTESQGMGIYKSFNYEIFERRPSAVVAFDGNSAAANLIQEAKNGKGKSAIFVWEHSKNLMQKAKSLHGYVYTFGDESSLVKIMTDLQKDLLRDVRQ